MSYSLNVIPMDLFCLSGISCRVIDYGQFSKHPTANTWSISEFFFCALISSDVCLCCHCIQRMVGIESERFSYLFASVSISCYCVSIVFLSTNGELQIQFNWFCWLCSEILPNTHFLSTIYERTFDYPFSHCFMVESFAVWIQFTVKQQRQRACEFDASTKFNALTNHSIRFIKIEQRFG